MVSDSGLLLLSQHRDKNMSSINKKQAEKKVFNILHKDSKGNSKLPWASKNIFDCRLKVMMKLGNNSSQCSEEPVIIT